jgi:hypothetical protein
VMDITANLSPALASEDPCLRKTGIMAPLRSRETDRILIRTRMAFRTVVAE